MRCNVRTLRCSITKALAEFRQRIMHGKIWVSLEEHMELCVVGARVLHEPRDWIVQDLKDELERYKDHLAQIMKEHQEFSDYHLSISKDEKAQIEYLKKRIDELQRHLNSSGMVGTITECIDAANIVVDFDDQPKLDVIFYAADLLVEVDNPTSDWRPNETLPEDYYAL